MTPPGTFERVYAGIRKRLREGMYRPGERLEPAVLSDELNASVTPVRDALHRLTGERLVEAPRHEGFRSPMMTETTLRHLYAWHLDLLLVAVAKHRLQAAELDMSLADESATAGYERQDVLFMALARSTGNPEHALALRQLADRLEPVQRFEQMFLEAVELESEQISDAIRAQDRSELRRKLVSYHRRRDRIVPQLLEQLLRTGAPGRMPD